MRERFRERESARVWTRRPATRDSGNGLRRWLPGFGKQYLGQATSFFFYDFPKESFAKDLWFCFWSYGKVADVYIPARWDRRGCRFGFVRMSEVSDVTDMERKLNEIWLGSYHLKVKVADNMKRGKEGTMVRQKSQIEKKWIRRDNKVNPRVTYAQVVAGIMDAIEDRNSSAHDLRQVSVLKENEPTGKRIAEDGVPLKAWSDRCFMELGGLIGELILVDEDTKSKSFLCEVEEEWRMDPDWWLARERRNPATDSDSEDPSNGYNFNEDGFLGDDVAELAEECAATALDVHAGLNGQGVLAEKDSGEYIREHGLGVSGLGLGSVSGPENVENGVQQAERGKLVPARAQHCRSDREKKYKFVEEIYVGGSGVMEPRNTEFSWVTERTKLRRDRKERFQMVRSRQEVQLEDSLTDGGFIGISGEWGSQQLNCNMVNVYAPCDRREKALLWEEMGGLVLEQGGRWLLAGDFNVVRSIIERKGRLGETKDMEEFNRFVEGTGLIDVKLFNIKYTWYRSDGTSMSRLDRFLLSSEMSTLERDWTQVGPFRALDVWQQHPKFRDFMAATWENIRIEGWAAFKCQKKLKLLKEECKRRNKEVFGNVEECSQEVWDILQKREAVWKQKSRANWVGLGDANTAFFHRCVHARRAQNVISGILGEDGWVEEPEMVKAEAVRYFCQLFQNEKWSRPMMGGIQFRKISAEQREWLERPFSIKEIEEGLHSCDDSKAPGPDGFNFNFIKFAWSTLKDDFVNFMCEFHQHGRLVKGLNSSFLALIPKKLNPLQFTEYRPISLLGCLYKLLAKVLANRLKMVMSDIISDSQSAFVGGRQLVDSVLILNEVVHEVKRRKQQSFMFKADFEKAYDCVDWGFLDWMMDSMGFRDKWRKWIWECLSTARISVLINGSPMKEFSVSKRLRQDDTIFIRKADAENVRVVKAILLCFELISGLKINFSKSHLYGFNVSDGWLQGAADMLHCGVGKVPFIYLGLLVGGNPGRKKFWKSVLDRFHQKLATWKSPLLSFGGRITLIHSRNFFWGGASLAKKIPWVSWECMSVEKGKGGLGVVNLERKKDALLGKWWFRLGDGLDSLWKRVIWGKYYGGRRERDVTSVECLNMSPIWKDIVSLGSRLERLSNMLIRGFKWEVGDGSCVDFWSDKWVGDKSLKELYPRLFVLAIRTEGILKDMGVWRGENWVWDCRWRCGCRGRAAEEEEHFRALINGFKLRIDREHSWKWVYSSDGCYSVKAAYEFLTPNSSFFEEKWAKGAIWVACSVMRGWSNFIIFYVGVRGTEVMIEGQLFESIQAKSFLWLKNKEPRCVFSYTDWMLRPRECREAIVQHCKNLKSAKKLQREAIWKSADQEG
ncbi:hypothetical protein SLEP1_g21338 [Rubroshorea leprosula]|uniref:RRM domain-containing protein n=1 Tax=Rubroshorea leprosula TaxID=152421 RepID=A0AAV5J5L8_9ROSI|nr:hypothetical protein SLEP1_g21338 [Rubroshorea leprosula]